MAKAGRKWSNMKRADWLNILRQGARMREMDINKTTKPTLEERAESPADDARKKLTQRDEVANFETFFYW